MLDDKNFQDFILKCLMSILSWLPSIIRAIKEKKEDKENRAHIPKNLKPVNRRRPTNVNPKTRKACQKQKNRRIS